MPLYHLQIPHDLTWYQTQVAMMKSQQLTLQLQQGPLSDGDTLLLLQVQQVASETMTNL